MCNMLGESVILVRFQYSFVLLTLALWVRCSFSRRANVARWEHYALFCNMLHVSTRANVNLNVRGVGKKRGGVPRWWVSGPLSADDFTDIDTTLSPIRRCRRSRSRSRSPAGWRRTGMCHACVSVPCWEDPGSEKSESDPGAR